MKKVYINFKRECGICGKEFTTHHGEKKYCSFECKMEATRRRAKECARKGKSIDTPLAIK